MTRHWHLFAICCVVFCSPALADDEGLGNPKILAELEVISQIDCALVPLPDILRYLGDLHDIPIEIDTKTLKKARIDYGPMQFTLKREGALHDCLLELLSQNELSFRVTNQKILVTTPEVAKEWHKSYSRRR